MLTAVSSTKRSKSAAAAAEEDGSAVAAKVKVPAKVSRKAPAGGEAAAPKQKKRREVAAAAAPATEPEAAKKERTRTTTYPSTAHIARLFRRVRGHKVKSTANAKVYFRDTLQTFTHNIWAQAGEVCSGHNRKWIRPSDIAEVVRCIETPTNAQWLTSGICTVVPQ